MATPAQDEWLRKLGVTSIPDAGRAGAVGVITDGGAAKANAGDESAAAQKKQLVARIAAAKRDGDSALERYKTQKEISDDQWIVSGLSRAAKEVTTLGGFEDPGPRLNAIVDELRACGRDAVAALGAGDLAKADAICARIEGLAKQAHALAQGYSEDLIDGAETAKTTVKVIDTGAKVVGGVALTVATGGAAAGVVAAEIGTATAISVAGGVAASTAGVATKLALGEKVDWGAFSIDILMQGLLARFGGKLTEGIAGAVAKRLGPAAATVGGAVIKNVAAQAVMHVNTTLFKTALESAYQACIGKDLTLQEVYDSCIAQLTDPSSLIVAAATAAAQGHVDAKVAGSSPPAAAAPATAPAAKDQGRGTAHAGGEGEAFTVEMRPESKAPEVVRVNRPRARPEARTEVVAESVPERRPVGESEHPMIDPDDLRMLSGRDEPEAPANRREAEEAAADRDDARLTGREETPVPRDAPEKPLDSASPKERLAWLRRRLRGHVDTAIERYASEVGLTPGQEAALLKNPKLIDAFRGSRIDMLAKDLIMQDPALADVITAPDFISEPDILSSSLPEWFDVTTQGSWLDHLRKYQERYGPSAVPLFTR